MSMSQYANKADWDASQDEVKEKPTVHYIGAPFKYFESAVLVPVDHPRADGRSVTNGHPVTTSSVISWDEKTGRIETLNTIYVPQEAKNGKAE